MEERVNIDVMDDLVCQEGELSMGVLYCLLSCEYMSHLSKKMRQRDIHTFKQDSLCFVFHWANPFWNELVDRAKKNN